MFDFAWLYNRCKRYAMLLISTACKHALVMMQRERGLQRKSEWYENILNSTLTRQDESIHNVESIGRWNLRLRCSWRAHRYGWKGRYKENEEKILFLGRSYELAGSEGIRFNLNGCTAGGFKSITILHWSRLRDILLICNWNIHQPLYRNGFAANLFISIDRQATIVYGWLWS